MTPNEIIEKLSEIRSKYNLFDENDKPYYTALSAAIAVINIAAKDIDGLASWEKVSGYATPGGDPVWRCSKCGKGLHVYGIEHGTYGEDIADGQWKACPNCGRVMI